MIGVVLKLLRSIRGGVLAKAALTVPAFLVVLTVAQVRHRVRKWRDGRQVKPPAPPAEGDQPSVSSWHESKSRNRKVSLT